MQMKLLVLLGLSMAAIPALATDSVTIKNKSDRNLHYSMRCADKESNAWKNFEAPPGQTRKISAAKCKQFGFKMATNKNDGSTATAKYTLDGNTDHVMLYDKEKKKWDLKKAQ
jgi:hypothetical protein